MSPQSDVDVPRPPWAPTGIDVDVPNAARVYDYFLGGAHNFAADRAMGDQALRAWPELPQIMRANRAFLRRAVRFLVDRGVRQFLDLGSGIPTVGNVHEVAQAVEPSCRVVYVDVDPVAVAHGRAVLAGTSGVTVVGADLREPAAVLGHPGVTGLLDLSRPVAVLLVAVLHFVGDDDDPAGIVAAYRRAMAPGSYLVICHASPDAGGGVSATHRDLYARTRTPMTMRTREQVAALLDGFEPVEPGLVYMASWRPEPDDDDHEHPHRFPGYAAVARRP